MSSQPREGGECASFALEYASSLGKAYSAVRELFLYDSDDALRTSLDRIFSLSYSAIFPLLISGWIKLSREEFLSLLRNLECLEFRYSSFRSRRSYTLAERLNTRAFDLYHGREDLASVLSSFEYLIKRYASDGAFRADLESENFYYGSKAAMKLPILRIRTLSSRKSGNSARLLDVGQLSNRSPMGSSRPFGRA